MAEATEAVVLEKDKQGVQPEAKPGQDAIAAAEAAAGKTVALFPEDDAALAKAQAAAEAETQAAAKTVQDAEAKAKAEAEARANATATATATQAAAPPASAPAQAAPATGKPASGQPPRKADPKDAAIIGLRKRLGEEAAERLRVEGENRVLREMARAKASGEETGAEVPAKVDEGPKTIEEIDKAITENWQAYEDGSIQPADYKRKELELIDRRQRLVAQEFAPDPSQVEDTVMTDHVEKLVGDYPILKVLSKDQLDPIFEEVILQAEAEGKPIPNTNRGTIELRERMAKLATEKWLPVITKTAAAAAVAPAASAAAASSAGKPGELSPAAKAREQKLELAGNHPPDISKIGAGAPGDGLTESALLEQLNALGGDEDAQLRLINANSAFVKTLMRGVVP